MIPNRFIHINEKETFEELKPEIDNSSITFCKESSEIVTHGENYGKAKWNIFPEPRKTPMPVVYVNKETGEKKVSKLIDKFKPDKWEPIGVIVIPKEHDVYGTGEGAMMSLKYMRYDTPEVGGEKQLMYWGPNGVLDEIRTAKPKLSRYSDENPTISSADNVGYFPSDKFNINISGQDKNVGYYYNYSSNTLIPSPYLTNGSRNPLYYDTDIVYNNILSHFNGKTISEKAWVKLDESIKNQDSISNTASNYPAFWTCHKYYTKGTKQGDWFLPSLGEIGYAFVRFKTINLVIDEINKVWPDYSVVLDGIEAHWSTSEASSSTMWCLNMRYGICGSSGIKYNNVFYARAFCRIKY